MLAQLGEVDGRASRACASITAFRLRPSLAGQAGAAPVVPALQEPLLVRRWAAQRRFHRRGWPRWQALRNGVGWAACWCRCAIDCGRCGWNVAATSGLPGPPLAFIARADAGRVSPGVQERLEQQFWRAVHFQALIKSPGAADARDASTWRCRCPLASEPCLRQTALNSHHPWPLCARHAV